MAKSAQPKSTNAQSAIADALNQCLADTVVGTMLAQNFHWNVKGMSFGALHVLFEEMYNDHFAAQDKLAERARALGAHAEGTLAGHVKRSKVKEHPGEASDKDMVRKLLEAQETISQSLKDCGKTAADNDDDRTEDLCIARGQVHDKFAWMLRAHLG